MLDVGHQVEVDAGADSRFTGDLGFHMSEPDDIWLFVHGLLAPELLR